jgi:lipopolysaccharide export system permease protein
MNRIRRYLFRQIGLPVAAACAALCGIGVLSQSLDQLEVIVERGQSAWTMARLTLLATPQLISLVLPIGVLVGALIALTRLQRENELTAAFAAGMTRKAVTSPAIHLAVLVALASLFVNLFVQPATQRELRRETFAIRTDLAALLVEEGEFVRAGDGLTVYVQQVEQNGLMTNLFVHLRQPDGDVITWDAQEARFNRIGDAPVLTMKNGSMQQFSGRGVLNFLSFDEYAFDLAPYAQSNERLRFKDSDLWLTELFRPTTDMLDRSGDRGELMVEAHARLSAPLYNLTAMALALAAILGGQFRRTGYGRRVAGAAAAFLVTRVLGYGLIAAGATAGWLAPLHYLLPLGVAAVALRIVYRGPRAALNPWRDLMAMARRRVAKGSLA